MPVLSIYIKKIDEAFAVDTSLFPQVSRDYLERNGFSQRLRDVHASIKRDNYEAGDSGTKAWQADVRTAVVGALDQMYSGDVPQERGVIDPKIAAARKFAATLSPEELAAAMAFIDKQRVKSGQSKAA